MVVEQNAILQYCATNAPFVMAQQQPEPQVDGVSHVADAANRRLRFHGGEEWQR